MWKWRKNVIKCKKFYHLATGRGLRACLHEGGGPQVGEVTCGKLPYLSCKRDHIKMRHYMDRRVNSLTWGPPPPCKQALKLLYQK